MIESSQPSANLSLKPLPQVVTNTPHLISIYSLDGISRAAWIFECSSAMPRLLAKSLCYPCAVQSAVFCRACRLMMTGLGRERRATHLQSSIPPCFCDQVRWSRWSSAPLLVVDRKGHSTIGESPVSCCAPWNSYRISRAEDRPCRRLLFPSDIHFRRFDVPGCFSSKMVSEHSGTIFVPAPTALLLETGTATSDLLTLSFDPFQQSLMLYDSPPCKRDRI